MENTTTLLRDTIVWTLGVPALQRVAEQTFSKYVIDPLIKWVGAKLQPTRENDTVRALQAFYEQSREDVNNGGELQQIEGGERATEGNSSGERNEEVEEILAQTSRELEGVLKEIDLRLEVAQKNRLEFMQGMTKVAEERRQTEESIRAEDEDRGVEQARQAAERRRVEDERKMVEEEARQVVERKMVEEEARKIAENKRVAEEVKTAKEEKAKVERKARQEEERRRAEDEEKKAAEEMEVERRVEEENRRAAGAARQVEERKWVVNETKRVGEEARKAEEKRRTEDDERRRGKEARKVKYEMVRSAGYARHEEERIVEQQERLIAESKAIAETKLKTEIEERESISAEVLQWPSEEQFLLAKKNTQYDPNKFNFAITGSSGSGKSSLINVFLGLRRKDPNAAPTGITETTLKIKRYPDPGNQPPHNSIVWFDVPGAGTSNIPSQQYFNQQGLFIFDLIIVVVDIRFTEVELAILENCRLFGIPSFIVRSKADQHISNMVKEELGSEDEADEDLQQNCRDELIAKTHQNVARELEKAGLPWQRVYIVSSSSEFRKEYSALCTGSEHSKGETLRRRRFIDETELIHDLLLAARNRRCGAIAKDINPGQEADRQEIIEDCLSGSAPPAAIKDLKQRKGVTHGRELTNGRPSTNKSETLLRRDGEKMPQSQDSRSEGVGSTMPITENQYLSAAQSAQILTQVVLGGNSAPFSIEMIQEIDADVLKTQLLVLSSTRTLATHVHSVLEPLGNSVNVRCCTCIGGTGMHIDERTISSGKHVISGTPGRVAQLIKRGSLQTDYIKVLVLNMNSGLVLGDEMYAIHRSLRPSTQIIRASRTG